MAQVTVTIAGRTYRMACADGEEAHLQGLARLVDDQINAHRQTFGAIGDQRITIMAAITIADDLAEAGRRIASLEQELAALRTDTSDVMSDQKAWADGVAESLAEAALRIERVVQGMNSAGRG